VVASAVLQVRGGLFGGDSDLFRSESSSVRELGPSWFDDHVEPLGDDDGVIVINFYSGSCGHCQRFSGTWNKVGAYAKRSYDNTHVTALNCDKHRLICTKYGVRGVPHLLGFAKGSNVADPTTGRKLPRDYDEILRWIAEADKDFGRSVFGSSSSSKKESQITENANSQSSDMEKDEMNALGGNDENGAAVLFDSHGNLLPPKEMMRRDIAAAVRFGLETGVFLGRSELVGDELAALYSWLNVLRESFPGMRERAQLEKLFRSLKEVERRENKRITSKSFDKVLESWDFAIYAPSQKTKWRAIWYNCHPESLKHVGVHGGFPCALWTLFHVLSVSSSAGGASADRTLNGIVGFIKYSFTCSDCREHFLDSNPDPQAEILQKARELGISPSRALTLWLWSEHNAVSKRLNAEDAEEERFGGERRGQHLRPVFPLSYQCRTCRIDPGASNLRRDMADATYLASKERSAGPNAAFRDQILHSGSKSGGSSSLIAGGSVDADGSEDTTNTAWDYDAVYAFLQHTYCFTDDPKLRCQVQDGSMQLSNSAIVFLLVIIAGGAYAYWQQRPRKSPTIKKT